MAEERAEVEAQVWNAAFRVQENEPEFARMLRLLVVEHGDIYTSLLPRSVSFGGAMADGRVQLLSRAATPDATHDILRLFGVIVLHARLARSCVVTAQAPGFFVRTESGPRPAFPLVQLIAVSGLERQALNAMMAPLVKDGAIRMLLDGEGNEAVMLTDGFSDDSSVRRFFRF